MFLRKNLTNIILIALAILYYLVFINKGIVLYDEGYFAHIAERIVGGEVPYKDFFIQFTPGYFYLLVLFYKLFGVSVLTGRVLTILICLGIAYLSLKLLDKFKIKFKLKLIAFLGVISFGFPLINNISLLAWPSVFLTLLSVIFFINKKYSFLGIILSLLLFTKQNLGIYFFILTNVFIIITSSKEKLKNIFLINGSFLMLTLIWFSYFFLILNGLDKFFELLKFNSRYLSVYHFSYPPLSFIAQPTGIFKLLPYYTPIIFGLIVIKEIFNKKKNIDILYLSTVSLVGFFGTVYPTSDLLHVYPFFGLLIISSVIFFEKIILSQLARSVVLVFIGFLIGIGFYLTLFKEYYRYQPRYLYQKTKLELPKAQNIYIDQPLALDLTTLNLFLLMNTKRNDYMLSYPFSPMLYFIFDRKNPTRYANYYPGYLTKGQEEGVIKNIRDKKVRFIITFLDYKFNTPISKFIQQQKLVFQTGEFKIFQIY